MKQILKFILKILARRAISHCHPIMVGITGSVGKTSAKEAVAAVLGSRLRVRASAGNLNNEFGVPLSILGGYDEQYYEYGGTPLFWLGVLGRELFRLGRRQNYPAVLILEFGANRPGDIAKLAADYKPKIGVVTGIGTVPVHIEFFESVEALTEEKAKLIAALEYESTAILNADDPAVLAMGEKTPARKISYGFSPTADVRVSDLKVVLDESGLKPESIRFVIKHGDFSLLVKIAGVLGPAHALAAAAGAAVGWAMGLNPADISRGLENYQGAPGRMKILAGVHDSIIIDDSYNSSPASAAVALETLKIMPAKRRVAVLGDMLELGQFSAAAHEAVGRQAALSADVLVCVGDKSRLTAEATKGGLNTANIYTFANAVSAGEKVRELIGTGDIILVKGSQGMRMERIVRTVMAGPERARELLVRQSKQWLAKA